MSYAGKKTSPDDPRPPKDRHTVKHPKREKVKITLKIDESKPPRKRALKTDPETGEVIDKRKDPGQAKHLQQYRVKRGEVRNPLGIGGANRKGCGIKVVSKAYTARLEDDCPLPGCEGMTWAEAIAKGIISAAANGDVSAAREVREVTEGKIPDRHQFGGLEDTPPIQMEVDQIDERLYRLLNISASAAAQPGTEDRANSAAGAAKQASKKK